MTEYRYRYLEQRLRDEISAGQLAAGERMPSVRQLCRELEMSKSTVLTAYGRLEAEGLIESRPRSGFFVTGMVTGMVSGAGPQNGRTLRKPAISQPAAQPVPVSMGQVLVDIMEKGTAFDLLPPPVLQPSQDDSGNEQLRRCLTRAQRRQTSIEQQYYDEPMGLVSLREQLALRMGHGGSQLSADELVITSGCQHGLLLALMATTEPGDVVALESPGFYGAFQLLEALGLKALELPSSTDTGISPDALELALEHWQVKALMLSPCYATPTGACMPETHKQRILTLAKTYGIAIIEDDIYGELHFGLQRPRSLHSYDDSGSVILCSSLSKCLSRDLRLGWIAPGKYIDKIKRLKVVTSLASSSTLQQGVSAFIEEGGLDRHLRQRRQQFRRQCSELQELIVRLLPMATACSYPEGGAALWLELPEQVDTLALYVKAREQGITITPGRLFSAQERYHNNLRLSFTHPWTDARRDALARLADLIRQQTDQA
jgi:DNA-binding transcriptional MocR family regulator